MKIELGNDLFLGLMVVAILVTSGLAGLAGAILGILLVGIPWAFFAWAGPAVVREYRATQARCEVSREAARVRYAQGRKPAVRRPALRRTWTVPSEKPWPILFDSLQQQSKVTTHNKAQ
jgi:hypothetical protein